MAKNVKFYGIWLSKFGPQECVIEIYLYQSDVGETFFNNMSLEMRDFQEYFGQQ